MVRVTKAQITTVVTAVVLSITATFGAMGWVGAQLVTHSATPHADSVSHQEFQLWVETQVRYNEQALTRLQSIEEAIRDR